jgi:hypothetical protein
MSNTPSEDVASSYSDYPDSSSSASTIKKPTLTARAFARLALGSGSDDLQPIRRPLPSEISTNSESESEVSRLFSLSVAFQTSAGSTIYKKRSALYLPHCLCFLDFLWQGEKNIRRVKKRKFPTLLAIFVLPLMTLDG